MKTFLDVDADFSAISEADLMRTIPPERHTYTPGEVASSIKVPRQRVVEAMRELGLRYCSTRNHVPEMDLPTAQRVVGYLKAAIIQQQQTDTFLSQTKAS